MDEGWTTCKPHPVGVAVWVLLSLAFSAAVGIILPIVQAPNWAFLIFACSAILAFLFGVAIASSRFRYNDSLIQSRYIRNIKRRWREVDGWSQLGKRGTLFIRFKDGTIIGSDGWALNDDDVATLIPILKTRIGEPKTGKETIMPWYVRFLLSSLTQDTFK